MEGYMCPGKLPTIIRVEKEGRAGVEPATYRAATDCSTTELTPRPYTRGNSGNNNKVNINTNAACVHSRDISYIFSVFDTLLEQQKANWIRGVAIGLGRHVGVSFRLSSSRTTSLVICDREDVIESETNLYSTQITLHKCVLNFTL
jgi:hypothetical protein